MQDVKVSKKCINAVNYVHGKNCEEAYSIVSC